MIELSRAEARARGVSVAPLTLRLESGVHALVGGADDGATIVLAMLAGNARIQRGSARVLDSLASDESARRAIAYVPHDVALPEPMRVDEVLAIAASIRGEPARDPVARLEALGVAALARRPVRSLSHDEKRAVALTEALTSNARVLLVDEPCASIDPRVIAHVPALVRARADAGACVVLATGSLRDARALADDVLLFERGALVRHTLATDAIALAGARGAILRVVSSDPTRLAASLVRDPSVASVAVEGDTLVARGDDPVPLASAIARAARETGLTIDSLRPVLLGSGELHAAIARGNAPRRAIPVPAEPPT